MDINLLKQNAPISEYIQKHYPSIQMIKSKGRDFIKCLWHEENTPSLALFEDTNKCKCFGCGFSGDLIDIVSKIENTTFLESCKIICNNVGISFENDYNEHHEKYKEQMDNHTRRYWSNLQKDPNALNYLLNHRRISPEMIDLFRLGLTDKEEYKYRNDIGNISNKISIPILEHKENGKCVGIAYRTLIDEEKPKYINDHNQVGKDSQDTNLNGVFIKSDCLFGMKQAINGIKKFNSIIITEGYFDVISLYQSGITNAVAIMCTSISDKQASEIKSKTNNVILMLDSDEAAKKSLLRNLKTLYKYNLNIVICDIPEKDPDELCKKLNFDFYKIRNIIEKNSIQSIEYITDEITINYRNISNKERLKALRQLNNIIEGISDESLRILFNNAIYKKLDMKV